MNSPASSAVPSTQRNLEPAAYGAIIVVAVLAKTLYTMPVEIGGDAIDKWEFVLDVLDGRPPLELAYLQHATRWVVDLPAFIFGASWSEYWAFVPSFLDDVAQSSATSNHQNARWAINLPTLAFTWAFGSSWFVYYLVPLFFYGIFLTLSAYFFRYYLSSPMIPFIVFILIVFADPLYARSITQLQPFIFVSAYITAHLIMVCKLVRDYRVLYCFFAALFMFLAYGAKATALFYAPATAIFIFWAMGWRSGLRANIYISLFGVALVVLETATFSLISGEIVTRLDVMHRHFSSLDARYSDMSFVDLLDGWTDISIYPSLLFALSAIIGAFYILKNFGHGTKDPIVLLALFFFVFSIFETFLVKSFDPLTPVTPPKPKYLADLVPWGSMIVAFSLGRMFSTYEQATRKYHLEAVALAAFVIVCGVSLTGDHKRAAWMWRAHDEHARIADMVRSGTPIHGGWKVSLYSRVISLPMIPVERDGKLFWISPNLDVPPDGLPSEQCLDMGRLLRANLKPRDCSRS